MNFIEISSKNNPVFKLVNTLNTSSKKRFKEGLFVLEGLRICTDAFENGIEIKMLIVSKTAYEKHKDEIEKLSIKSDKCYLFIDDLFNKMCDTTSPQGIIMVVKLPENKTKIIANTRYIALENLQDPSNLGAISRTAEALGFGGIILTDNGCNPYSPKALRASMGTLLRMHIIFTDDIVSFVKSNGLKTVSCVVESNAKDIKNHKFKSDEILVIGNEGNGLCEKTKKESDYLVTIKMIGKTESLNAASAAAIAMWEMCRYE